MKLSNYNQTIEIDDINNIIYNTFTRKYVLFSKSKKEYIQSLLGNLSKSKYTIDEAAVLRKLASSGILRMDDIEETEILRFYENKAKFQEETFYLVIQPTLMCNFRCIYCYQDHTRLSIDELTMEKIIKFVEKVSKRVRKLEVGWFGGEPLLQFKNMIYLTDRFKKICEENGCNYSSKITTNGYLLNEEVINKLEELCIEKIQITIDGTKEYHDKKRPLANGTGTFDKIKENFLRVLDKENIFLTMRINVDEENYDYIEEIFDIIPADKRNKVALNICNLFQNKGKVSLYDLYKLAINKGYKYYNTTNGFLKCEATLKNSITVQPNGKITPCSVAAENGLFFGELDDNGNINIKDQSAYIKFQNMSVLDNKKCADCKQLPMCTPTCKYASYSTDSKSCSCAGPEGLTFEERVKLHYYNDKVHNILDESNIL